MNNDPHDLSERVALFRHRLIAQLLPEELTARQRQLTIERIVAAEHSIPGTRRIHYLEENLASAEITLSAEELARLRDGNHAIGGTAG